MNRRRTTVSLGRPRSSSERPIIIALSLCSLGANSWHIVGTASRLTHATSAVGSSRHGSLSCASCTSPWHIGFAFARRSILWTTLPRYAGRGDGDWRPEDLPPDSRPPEESFLLAGWRSLLLAENTSWQEYFASLRIDCDLDLDGAAVATSEGHVSKSVSQGKGAVMSVEYDPRDGQLVVAADAAAENNCGNSEGKRNNDSSSPGKAPKVLIAADDEEGKSYCEKRTNHEQQSAEATVEEDSFKSVLVEAAEIMASRGESDAASADCAYRLLNAERDALRESGGGGDDETLSSSLTKATAAALLSWIRCKTEGNGLVVAEDGRVATSDTADRRELWAAHAPTVLQLLDEVGQEPASDVELQQLYTEAIMYSTSSQGILEAFVTGKALAFTSAMNVLVKHFPAQDNGVAHIFKGSYFLAAPWPLRSPPKARESFEKAVKVNGRSRRNVYYAGVGRLACGDREGAAEMFRRAVSDEHCESASATERDIARALREQSRKGLAVCERGATA